MTDAALLKLRPLARTYADFLDREGFEPTLLEGCEDEEATGLYFVVEGHPFLLFAYENEPGWFRVGLQLPFEPWPGDPVVASLANELNHDLACVKLFVDPENHGVRFMVDTFLAGHPVGRAPVEHATASIRSAIRRLRGELHRRELRAEA